MATIPRIGLERFFRLFAPEYVLGTTYTVSPAFFEAVVLPCIDRSQLRKCLVLCDQVGFRRATSEASALRAASREYILAVAPTERAFHPKLWLMLRPGQLAILVGSGNLTHPGFVDNTELFEAVEVRAGGTGRSLVESASRFVAGLKGLWGDTPRRSLLVVDTLVEIEEQISEIAGTLSDEPLGGVRLLTSFDGPFLDAFRAIGRAGDLYIVSPYFGGSVAGIVAIQSALEPRSTHVFPGVHSDGTIDVPLADLQTLPNTTVHSLALAAQKSGLAHLKLYGFENPAGECWLFSGSVNCTTAALQGENVEAGLLRRVPKSVFALYFAADRKKAPPAKLRQQEVEPVPRWLTFHATDMGSAIEIAVPPSLQSALPLVDVQLDLCMGAVNRSASMPSLFSHGPVDRLPWSMFHDGRRIPQASRVLHLSAMSCTNEPVSGSAFVDDLAALTAEPAHRNAWRAALALLSAEGLPQYSDLAALFALVDEVVRFEASDKGPTSIDTTPSLEGSTRVALKDKAAVWPPRSLNMDSALLGAGQPGQMAIYWFNRILAALVQKPTGGPEGRSLHISGSDEKDDGADTGLAAETVAPAAIRACQRMLDRALERFDFLQRRLKSLELTERHATKIWGPATFIFLGLLGIKNAVERTPGEFETPSTMVIARNYLSMMFADRMQDVDYTPCAGSRYLHAVFPPIAEDLATTFGVYPHFEICAVVLATFAHLHALEASRGQQCFSLAQWLLFRDVAGDNLAAAYEDSEHLEHLWRRYLDDGRSGITWTVVARSLEAILGISWSDHPGFRDLTHLMEKGVSSSATAREKLPEHLRDCIQLWQRNGSRVEPVTDRYAETCPNDRCCRHTLVDPRFRSLRQMRPVICLGCGSLLVPVNLFKKFMVQAHDRVS